MVSPSGGSPTYARDNKNRYMSSLLAWVRGPKAIIGGRNFPGFYVWDLDADADALEGLPSSCRTALAEVIQCDRYVQTFLRQAYRQSLHNDTLTASVCDSTRAQSLKGWFDNVASICSGHNVSSSASTKFGGQIWAGWNETCLQDPVTKQYCNDVIAEFDTVSTKALPHDQLCSFCFVERLKMMQRSPYLMYDKYFQADLQVVHEKCGLNGPTDMPPSLDAVPELDPNPICVSGNTYTTTSAGETCDSIALKFNVSSAALFMANPAVSVVCGNIAAKLALCLPLPCETTYVLKANDTCTSIELANNYRLGDVRRYNSWVSWDCSNLHKSVGLYGGVLCLGPQGGTYPSTAPIPRITVSPVGSTGYLQSIVPPPSNVTVANGTTLRCGRWHVAVDGDSCPSICIQESITADLFLEVNPSLSSGLDCTGSLVRGSAYCVGP
ncbi:pectin lyase-like protein [Aspergillus lentulus]|uniref:Pectin lyase-like protein n=1 Tax=Aspergillus lentulus TaxID=293939 RepID=A0ABQ0ZTA1_ASPLE|nr:pectin lyase-like protein [Aspergillus lentulus]